MDMNDRKRTFLICVHLQVSPFFALGIPFSGYEKSVLKKNKNEAFLEGCRVGVEGKGNGKGERRAKGRAKEGQRGGGGGCAERKLFFLVARCGRSLQEGEKWSCCFR